MKRVFLATTALVVAGGMAAADVSVSGSAELGVAGTNGKDASDGVRVHRDIRVKFGLSGATDTGLSFGASADFHNAGKYRSGGSEGAVHVTGAFGTLTLGNTDGGFDKALSEVGSATSIADDHTSHPGYNGNSGLDGFTGNGGGILRYDYSLGGVTASVSGEWDSAESSNSAIGAGVAWSGDMGGVGLGVGVGWQSGKKMVGAVAGNPALCAASATDATVTACTTDGAVELVAAVAAADKQSHKASIIGMSASANMGNGLSVVANYSRKNHDVVKGDMDVIGSDATAANIASGGDLDTMDVITHTAVGIAYSVGDVTVGVNAGTMSTKTTMIRDTDAADATQNWMVTTEETKANGVGVGVVYSLGTGASLQLGVGSGKKGDAKESSWSAGLSFSF